MRQLLCALLLCVPVLCRAQTLQYGPIVGNVTPTTATIWVGLTAAHTGVAIEYAPATPGGTWVRTASAGTTTFGSVSAVKIALSALQPHTRYEYWVLLDGVRQPLISARGRWPYAGRFMTAPRPGDSPPFTLLVLTDFSNILSGVGNPPPLPDIPDWVGEEATLAVILGDYDHRNPVSLSGARNMRRDNSNCLSPYRAAICEAVYWRMAALFGWDDHDYADNNSDKTHANRANAFQTYQDYFPHWPLAIAGGGIAQEITWGHVQLLQVDNRYHRDINTDPDNAAKSMLDGDAIGALGQKQWVKDRLIAPGPIWRVLLSGSAFNRTYKSDDGWAAFTTEFDELLTYYNANLATIKGLFSIGGDLHATAMHQLSTQVLGKVAWVAAPFDSDGCDTGGEGSQDLGCPHCDSVPPGSRIYPTCSGFNLVRFRTNPHTADLLALSHDGRTTYLQHRLSWP